MRPLGTWVGALTEDFVRKIQKLPGRHGHVDVTYFEPPRPVRDKFSKLAALRFKGEYPDELVVAPPAEPEPPSQALARAKAKRDKKE